MKVQDIEKNEPAFHVSNSHGKLLIAQGLVFEVAPPTPGAPIQFFPEMQWALGTYGYNGEPFISYRCNACGMHDGRIAGATAPTARIFHCGVRGGDPVSREVANDFRAARERWQATLRKPPTPEQTAEDQKPKFALSIF
jgi:hypothetical protein